MVLFFASSFSCAAARSYCKNETSHKPLTYMYVDRNWGAELSAIAGYSAPLLGTTVHRAGSAVGHTDPTRWEQEHGRRRQQACTRGLRIMVCSPTPPMSMRCATALCTMRRWVSAQHRLFVKQSTCPTTWAATSRWAISGLVSSSKASPGSLVRTISYIVHVGMPAPSPA